MLRQPLRVEGGGLGEKRGGGDERGAGQEREASNHGFTPSNRGCALHATRPRLGKEQIGRQFPLAGAVAVDLLR